MENEILEILKELKPEEDFQNSESFIDDELLDSFDVITLMSMLEEKYGIVIDGLDIVPENFESIETIIRLINRSKRA